MSDHSTTPWASHGISQAGILVWVAISSSSDLPDPGTEPISLTLTGEFLTTELPAKPLNSTSLCNYYIQIFNIMI